MISNEGALHTFSHLSFSVGIFPSYAIRELSGKLAKLVSTGALPLTPMGKRQRSSIRIAHHCKHASNALLSLTRAACRMATVCSLQTQAGTVAGWATPVSCTKVPTFRNPCK